MSVILTVRPDAMDLDTRRALNPKEFPATGTGSAYADAYRSPFGPSGELLEETS